MKIIHFFVLLTNLAVLTTACGPNKNPTEGPPPGDLESVVDTGVDCWYMCGEQEGPCDWCKLNYSPQHNLCCRYGENGIGCDGTFGGLRMHECARKPECLEDSDCSQDQTCIDWICRNFVDNDDENQDDDEDDGAYVKVPKRSCKHEGVTKTYAGYYLDLDDAKAACSADPDCGFVEDGGCNKSGHYKLCKKGFGQVSRTGTFCMYKKIEVPCETTADCKENEPCTNGFCNGSECDPYSERACRDAANSLGLSLGGGGWSFVGYYSTKGCFAYSSGESNGHAFYGAGGTLEEMKETVGEVPAGQQYRPVRYDCIE